MLPQELSTDICSLRPHEDRLVLSCIMQLDAAGRIESFEIVEGVIRSAARMTYTEVSAIIEGDAETRARYAPLVENFERMKKLAVLMNQRREERELEEKGEEALELRKEAGRLLVAEDALPERRERDGDDTPPQLEDVEDEDAEADRAEDGEELCERQAGEDHALLTGGTRRAGRRGE